MGFRPHYLYKNTIENANDSTSTLVVSSTVTATEIPFKLNHTGTTRVAADVVGGDLDVANGSLSFTEDGQIRLFGLGDSDSANTEEIVFKWDSVDSIYRIETTNAGTGLARDILIGDILRVDSNGNVGIGTDGPIQGLTLGTGKNLSIFNGNKIGSGSIYTGAGSAYSDITLYDGSGDTIFVNTFPTGDYKFTPGTSGNFLITNGNVGIGATSPGAKLEIETGAAATKGLIIQAAASQTANLTEWQNSSGTVIAYVAADGSSSFGGTTTVGDLNIESLGTADSVTTSYASENLTWNGSYWDGAAAQNTNGVIYLSTGVTQNFFSITPDDRNAGEYQLYHDELVTPGTITTTGATINGATSITGPLSVNTVVGSHIFRRDGVTLLAIQNESPNVLATPRAAAYVPFAVKGMASQTANLTDWQNSTGTVLSSIRSTGDIRFEYSGAKIEFKRPSIAEYASITHTGTQFQINAGNWSTTSVQLFGQGYIEAYAPELRLTATSPLITATTSSGSSLTIRANSRIKFDTKNGGSTTTGLEYQETGIKQWVLESGGVGTLEQRDGSTAQTYRLYHSYADASNYSRLTIGSNLSGGLAFHSDFAGTGTGRKFIFKPGDDYGSFEIYKNGGNTNNWILLQSEYAGYSYVSVKSATSTRSAGYTALHTDSNQAWRWGVCYSDTSFHIQPGGLGQITTGTFDLTTTGDLTISGRYYGDGATLTAASLSDVPTIIKAAASQTANLTEWQNSTGTVLSCIDASGNLGIGTNDPSSGYKLHVEGAGYFDGNIMLEATGVTSASPRTFGFLNAGTNSSFAGRYDLDSGFSGLQGGSQKTVQLYGFWGVRIEGHRRTAAPSYVNGATTDPSLTVIQGRTDSIGLVVQGIAAATTNLTEWKDSSSNTVASILMDGKLSLDIVADNDNDIPYIKLQNNLNELLLVDDSGVGPGIRLSSNLLPAFRAVSDSGDAYAGSSFSINKPTGTVSGDLLILIISGEASSDPNYAVSGFTEIASDSKSSVLYKVAGGAEPASYTVTGSYIEVSAVMYAFSNAAAITDSDIAYINADEQVVHEDPGTINANSIFLVWGSGESDSTWTNKAVGEPNPSTGWSSHYRVDSTNALVTSYQIYDEDTQPGSITHDHTAAYTTISRGYLVVSGSIGTADDVSGLDFILHGGPGTGTGNGGDLVFRTSPASAISGSSVNPQETRMTIDSDGNFVLHSLPSTDPGISNAIWSDDGVVVLSGTTANDGNPSSGVAGAVQFSDGSGGFNSDETNLFWDDTNDRFGIGTSTPRHSLEILDGNIASYNVSGSYGVRTGHSDSFYWEFKRDSSSTGRLQISNQNGEMVSVLQGGNFGIGETSPGAKLQVNTTAAATTGLTIKGFASQTANLTEWQNSSGTVLASVDEAGNFATPTISINSHLVSQLTSSLDGQSTSRLVLGDVAFLNNRFRTSFVGSSYRLTLSSSNISGQTAALLFGLDGSQNDRGLVSDRDSGDLWITNGPNSNSSSYTPRITVKTTGNVGVGATDPGAKLQVNSGTAATIGFIVKAAASQTANLTEWQNSSGTVLSCVDENGYVGIGTSSPGTKLHVVETNLTGSATTFIYGQRHNLLAGTGETSSAGYILNCVSGTSTTGSGGTSRLYVRNDGNIGIGTSSPGAKLDVYGGYVRIDAAAGPTDVLRMTSDALVDNFWAFRLPSSFADLIQLCYYNGSSYITAVTCTDYGYVTFPSAASANRDTGFNTQWTNGVDGQQRALLSYDASATRFKLLSPDGTKHVDIQNSNTNTTITSAVGLQLISQGGNQVQITANNGGYEVVTTANTTYMRNGSNTTRLIIQGVASQTANLTEWQNSSGTVIAYVAADGSSSFSGTTTVSDLNIESLGTADSTNTTYNSENLTWNGSYWDGAAAQDTNAVVKLVTGVTENYFSITPDDRNAGEYKFHPDELYLPGKLRSNTVQSVSGILSLSDGNQSLVINGNEIRGSLNSYYDLGTAAYKWNNIYSNAATLSSETTSSVPLSITAITSQAADLTEWKNSSGTVLTSIQDDGVIYRSISSTGVTYFTDFYQADSGGMTDYGAIRINGARGTVSAPDYLWSGRTFGGIIFRGHNGTDYVDGVKLEVRAASNHWNLATGAAELVFKVLSSATVGTIVSTGMVTQYGLVAGDGLGSACPLSISKSGSNAAVALYSNDNGYMGTGMDASSTFWGIQSGNSASIAKNTSLFFVEKSTGIVGINQLSLTLGAQLGIVPAATTRTGMVIRAAASQTANLTEWQNSSGTVLASVTAGGHIIAPQRVGIGSTSSPSYALHVRGFGMLSEITGSGYIFGNGSTLQLSGEAGQYIDYISNTTTTTRRAQQQFNNGSFLYIPTSGYPDVDYIWKNAAADEVFKLDMDSKVVTVGGRIHVNDNTGVRIGNGAAATASLAENMVAIGYQALNALVTATGCIAIGSQSLSSKTTTGNGCVAIGYLAQSDCTTGEQNVSLGNLSLSDVTTGSHNLAIGHNSGRGITTGSYNTIIGTDVQGLSASLSNTIIIGDGQGNQRIYVDSTGALTLNSAFTFPTTDGSANQVLKTNGSGVLTWSDPDDVSNTVGVQTGAYTLTSSDNILLADATTAAFAVTLPDPSTVAGRIFVVKKIDSTSNSITLTPNDTETIDGLASIDISIQYESYTVTTDGTNWFII